MAMGKEEIRRLVQNITRKITAQQRSRSSNKALQALIELDQLAEPCCVALFYDLPDEIASREWIEPLQKMGHRVLIPRVEGDEMEFYDYHTRQTKVGAFGIIEPTSDIAVAASEIDVMILPGVAFTRDGSRLGRGRGYYDRYLCRLDFRAYTIGVGYSHQLLDELPCEEHDRRVDHIIMPFVLSPLPDIMSGIVESAGEDATRLGCGVDRLLSMGYTWVLLRFMMELKRTPEAEEQLSIETWINGCERLTSTRNFVVRDLSGELLGEAVSQWCMIDIHTRRPVDLHSPEIDYRRLVTPRDGAKCFEGKVDSIDQDAADFDLYTHTVTREDLDFNSHVNTFKYVEMMLSMLPHTTLLSRGELAVDIQFVKECYLGEELTIMYQPQSHFEIAHSDGKSAVRAHILFGAS